MGCFGDGQGRTVELIANGLKRGLSGLAFCEALCCQQSKGASRGVSAEKKLACFVRGCVGRKFDF